MDLHKALQHYTRAFKSIYSCGEAYDSLIWDERNEMRKPSLQDLEAEWDLYCTEKDKNKYKLDRANAYLPVIDQLDMIYNHGVEEWMKYIESVKKRYPSPNQTNKPQFINPMDDLKKQIANVASSTEQKINEISQELSVLKSSTQDVNAAILAIRGFMMEIPNIQKSLLDLQDMVKPK